MKKCNLGQITNSLALYNACGFQWYIDLKLSLEAFAQVNEFGFIFWRNFYFRFWAIARTVYENVKRIRFLEDDWRCFYRINRQSMFQQCSECVDPSHVDCCDKNSVNHLQGNIWWRRRGSLPIPTTSRNRFIVFRWNVMTFENRWNFTK